MSPQVFQYKSIAPDNRNGIYVKLKDVELRVLPLALYETLWDCHTRRRLCIDVEAIFQIFTNEVTGYFFDYSVGYYSVEFERESFVTSAKEALRLFCNDVLNFAPTIYGEKYFNDAHAKRMLEGLEAMVLPRNYSQLFSRDVKIEKLTFEFIEEYDCDTRFVIGLGDRLYHSNFSDWSNNLEVIRHQLEGMVLCPNGNVQLFYEDSPNTISIKRIYLHDTRQSEYVKVTLYPDEFVDGPILFGYCDRKQFVKTLYEGLLQFTLKYPLESNDYETRFEAYAKIKSPLIEQYIKDEKREYRKAQKRDAETNTPYEKDWRTTTNEA